MSKLSNVWAFSDSSERYAELLAAAQQLGEKVTAATFGTADSASALFHQGADSVCVLGEKSSQQLVEGYAETIVAAVRSSAQPVSAIVLPATRRSKALAVRLSVQLEAALVNDALTVEVVDGKVEVQHRVYGGLAYGREKINTPIAIITVAPGAFDALAADTSRTGDVFQADYITPAHVPVCRERRVNKGSSVDLAKAKRVIGIGRGLAAQADLSMINQLAEVLGAEVGCSRPIAEGEHWMERERYIGVSGVSLKSDVYLMLGISGQIQHMVGAAGAKTIIAINKDKNAPIFQFADYGLVADIYKAVPALIDLLKR
jgi:electron transfer flavoprotein alpha subunit